jgi:hypothetical protein
MGRFAASKFVRWMRWLETLSPAWMALFLLAIIVASMMAPS